MEQAQQETKATPGPWRLEYDSDVLDPDFGPVVKWPHEIIGKDGAVVLEFCGFVREADARLLTAAPDLKEALAGYVIALALNGGYTPTDIGDWAHEELRGKQRTPAQVIRAAIATLKGGAQ